MIISQNAKKIGNKVLIHSYPAFYRDSEDWKDVNLDTVASTEWETERKNITNNFMTYFNDKSDLLNPTLASFEYQDKWINYKLVDATPSETVTEGNKVSYLNVYPDTDLSYKVTHNGLKEEIIVKNAEAIKLFYEFTIKTNAKFADFNTTSFMIDAEGKRGAVHIALAEADYKEKAYESVCLIPDSEFLKTAVYPVVIDPTTTIQPASQDTYIASDAPTTNYATETSLRANPTAPERISFLEFDVSAITNEIVDGELGLYAWSIGGSGATVSAHKITESWTDTSVTYNAQPTYVVTPVASDDTAGTTVGWLAFDVGIYNDNGYALTSDQVLSMRSSNYTTDTNLRPKLTVTYRNDGPTITAPASTTEGSPTSYSNELTPNITATVSGYTLTKFRVYVFDSDDNLYFDSGEVTDTSIDYDVPLSADLEYNTTYGIKVKALDNDGYWTEVSTEHFLTCAMTAISDLSTSDVTAGIKLDWTASSGEGITGYNVYRSLTTSTGFELIGSTTDNEFTDYKIESGTTYYYHVKVKEGTNESSASNEVSNDVVYSGWYLDGLSLNIRYGTYSRRRIKHVTSRAILGQDKNTVQDAGYGGNIIRVTAQIFSEAEMLTLENALDTTDDLVLHHDSVGQWKVKESTDLQINYPAEFRLVPLVFEEVE